MGFLGLYRARPTDQFAAPFDESPIIGRAVDINVPIDEKWADYDSRSQILKVLILVETADRDLFDPDLRRAIKTPQIRGIDLASREEGEESSDGENAPIVAQAARVDTEHDAIGVLSNWRWSNADPGTWTYSGHMPAEQARIASQNLVMHVTGTVVAYRPGETIACYVSRGSDRIYDSAHDSTDKCFVIAKLDHVELIDSASHHVLATFRL